MQRERSQTRFQFNTPIGRASVRLEQKKRQRKKRGHEKTKEVIRKREKDKRNAVTQVAHLDVVNLQFCDFKTISIAFVDVTWASRLSMNTRSSSLAICTASGLNLLPVMLSQMFSYCCRTQPTDCSQLVLLTRGDECHKLHWTNLSTSVQFIQLVRAHWRIAQPCRQFCDAAYADRHLSKHALRLTTS